MSSLSFAPRTCRASASRRRFRSRWALLSLIVVVACGPALPTGPTTPPPTPPPDEAPAPPPDEAPAPPPPPSVHLALGVPVDATPQDDALLVHDEMAIGYSRYLNAANWVAWRTTPADFGDAPRYSGDFLVDTTLPADFHRPTHADYTGSGYDRGHMVRSEERTETAARNRATFVLSNILPQTPDLNRGPWLRLERLVESTVKSSARPMDAYVIAGAIWSAACATHRARSAGDGCADLGRAAEPARRVAVPEATFKIVVFVPAGQPVTSAERQVLAVAMPNTAGILSAPWQDYQTTVEALEQRTGYDFLTALR